MLRAATIVELSESNIPINENQFFLLLIMSTPFQYENQIDLNNQSLPR